MKENLTFTYYDLTHPSLQLPGSTDFQPFYTVLSDNVLSVKFTPKIIQEKLTVFNDTGKAKRFD